MHSSDSLAFLGVKAVPAAHHAWDEAAATAKATLQPSIRAAPSCYTYRPFTNELETGK